MNGGSAARVSAGRQPGVGQRRADLPVALRWRESESLGQAIRTSLLEPDFPGANDSEAWPDGGRACLFLAVSTLLGLQPSYAVAVVDQDGRLRFKETLQFRFLADTADGPRVARPDADTARRLERLGALLAEQIVYVPDELAADLDSLREPMSRASCVHSLSPLLARRARLAGGAQAQALSDWASLGFDSVPDPAERARFMLKARDGAACQEAGGPA